MITLQAICQYLEEFIPSEAIADYCPNGLQVEGSPHCAKIGTAVSASLETIQAAVDRGIEVLIVHHGLFWNRDPYVITGSKREKIALLLKHGISLLAYHLPLDAHREVGNNWKAAREMGWLNLEPFGLVNGTPIGVKGIIDTVNHETFKKRLEEYYQHPAHAALGGKKEIQSAALVSGGAHKQILEAAEAHVDAFITGSFDEPIWYIAREEKINFYALGHSATERIGPRALAEQLGDVFSIPAEFIDIHNPF